MEQPSPTLQERKRQYLLAMRAFEGQDYFAAARTFAVVATEQDLCGRVSAYYAAEASLRLGLQLMQQADFEAAVRSFEQALQFNPRSHSLAQYLACSFAKLQRFDRAIRYSDREVSLRGSESDPRIRLALSQWRDGQQAAAIQSLREGILLQSGQVEWHFQLGVLLSAREEHHDALESFRQVIELAPAHAEALMHMGLCHGALQEPEEAVHYLSLAQLERPHDAKTGLFLAVALKAAAPLETSQPVEVASPTTAPVVGLEDVEELTQIVSDEPEVIEAFVGSPELENDGNLFELLAAVLDRAILRRPRSAELHFHRGQAYGRLGRADQAIASCERAVEIDPGLVQALVTLAKLYLQSERHDDARVRLQQVLDLGYEYADVHFHLGCIYRDRGERQRAKESYHRALQINSGYVAAREALESLAA